MLYGTHRSYLSIWHFSAPFCTIGIIRFGTIQINFQPFGSIGTILHHLVPSSIIRYFSNIRYFSTIQQNLVPFSIIFICTVQYRSLPAKKIVVKSSQQAGTELCQAQFSLSWLLSYCYIVWKNWGITLSSTLISQRDSQLAKLLAKVSNKISFLTKFR